MMVAILGLLGTGLVGCGASSSDLTEQETCNQAVGAVCQKMSSCLGAATFGALYSSVADCTTQLETLNSCATKTCPAPQKFVTANGQACLNFVNAMSCPDIEALTGAPSACADSLMCQ